MCTDKNSGYETVVLVGITKCKLWQRTLKRQLYIIVVITILCLSFYGKICRNIFSICLHRKSADLSDQLSQDWSNGFVSRIRRYRLVREGPCFESASAPFSSKVVVCEHSIVTVSHS